MSRALSPNGRVLRHPGRAPAKSRFVRFVPLAALAQVSGGRQLAVASSHEHPGDQLGHRALCRAPASGGVRWPPSCRHQRPGVPGSWARRFAALRSQHELPDRCHPPRSTITTEGRPVSRLLSIRAQGDRLAHVKLDWRAQAWSPTSLWSKLMAALPQPAAGRSSSYALCSARCQAQPRPFGQQTS
jgi:hypothetical protein